MANSSSAAVTWNFWLKSSASKPMTPADSELKSGKGAGPRAQKDLVNMSFAWTETWGMMAARSATTMEKYW
jgi:hypothetical protein